MPDRYIPTRVSRLLDSMKRPFYDWLGGPFDGDVKFDNEEKEKIEQMYGIEINTYQNGFNFNVMQPSYKVTVRKGDKEVSFESSQEIPKKWGLRLKLKK